MTTKVVKIFRLLLHKMDPRPLEIVLETRRLDQILPNLVIIDQMDILTPHSGHDLLWPPWSFLWPRSRKWPQCWFGTLMTMVTKMTMVMKMTERYLGHTYHLWWPRSLNSRFHIFPSLIHLKWQGRVFAGFKAVLCCSSFRNFGVAFFVEFFVWVYAFFVDFLFECTLVFELLWIKDLLNRPRIY